MSERGEREKVWPIRAREDAHRDRHCEMDDDAFCAICSIHFSNSATLAKHCAAIHQASAAPSPPAAAAAPATREKRPAGSSIPVESEQIELAPLLAVLSDQQKDAILLRAVQHEPDFFYDRIFEQATAPLTDEAANARLTSMDPEAFASAIKFFLGAGVAGNALSLLVAASQRCLGALKELVDARQQAVSGGNAAAVATEEEADDDAPATLEETKLAVVEALPPVGALAALWVDVLGKPSVRALLGDDEITQLRLLFEGLQGAAGAVRPFAAAVLVGSLGETADLLDDAMRRLDDPKAAVKSAEGETAPSKKQKKLAP